jgi:ATP-dependent 26S proteasome regulatory subunit
MTATHRWATSGGHYWSPDGSVTVDTIPAGIYECGSSPSHGYILMLHPVATDGLVETPDSDTGRLVEELRRFWAMRQEFERRGLVHKRGFLLWGPPGAGKTSLLNRLTTEVVSAHGGIVLHTQYLGLTRGCLQMARRAEPNRPILVIIEDVDSMADDDDDEVQLLALLDGQSQVGNVVFLATTNYPDQLSERMTRPSRFDTIQYIGMPSADARRAYLAAKEPGLTGAELDRWVAVSDGFSFAHLKELIIAVACLGQTLDNAVKRMESGRAKRPETTDLPIRAVA